MYVVIKVQTKWNRTKQFMVMIMVYHGAHFDKISAQPCQDGRYVVKSCFGAVPALLSLAAHLS